MVDGEHAGGTADGSRWSRAGRPWRPPADGPDRRRSRGEAVPRWGSTSLVVGDQAADGLAHAQPLGGPHENGQIEPAARLVPTAEGAGGGVFADRFARLALQGELPVVNDAGPLRGQMRDQPGLDQAIQQRPGAVLDQMGTVSEHDGRPALAGGEDAFGQPRDLGVDRRRGRRVDGPHLFDQFGHVEQVPSLGERKDLQSSRVNGRIRHGVGSSSVVTNKSGNTSGWQGRRGRAVVPVHRLGTGETPCHAMPRPIWVVIPPTRRSE